MKAKILALSLIGFILLIFHNGCSQHPQTSSLLQQQKIVDLGGLTSNGNGRTYDGKLSYQSRYQVQCDGKATPAVVIENEVALGQPTIVKNVPLESGTCEQIRSPGDQDAVAFEPSQLAVYNNQFHDQVLNFGDLILDNKRTKIVCKSTHGSLAMLDNMWSGAVVMETESAKVWASRLDFSERSPETEFLFTQPPLGGLVQTKTSLEFRTAVDAATLRPKVYQMMHTRIERAYEESLSPSLNYGQKIYPGTMQFYYWDLSVEPVFSISTAQMPVKCFVDHISLDRMSLELSSSYDFTQHFLSIVTKP